MLAGRQPVKRAGCRRVTSKKHPPSQKQQTEQTLKRIIDKHEAYPIRYQIQEINIRVAKQHLSDSETDQNWKVVGIDKGYYSRTANCVFIKVGSVEKSEIDSQIELDDQDESDESENASETEANEFENESEASSVPSPTTIQNLTPVQETNVCTCCRQPRASNHKTKRLMTDLRKSNLSKTTYPVISVEIYTTDRERWLITSGEMIEIADYLVIFGDLVISPINKIPLSAEVANKYNPDSDSESNDEIQLVTTDPVTASQENIELVVSQTNCSREQAIKALELNNNDIVEAIMNLTE